MRRWRSTSRRRWRRRPKPVRSRIRRTAVAAARDGLQAAYRADRSDGAALACTGCGGRMRHAGRRESPVETVLGRAEWFPKAVPIILSSMRRSASGQRRAPVTSPAPIPPDTGRRGSAGAGPAASTNATGRPFLQSLHVHLRDYKTQRHPTEGPVAAKQHTVAGVEASVRDHGAASAPALPRGPYGPSRPGWRAPRIHPG